MSTQTSGRMILVLGCIVAAIFALFIGTQFHDAIAQTLQLTEH